MTQRADEVKAGILVFAGFGMFVGALLFIFGALGSTNLVEYRTILPSSGGVEPGTDVRFGGIKVGRVGDVSLSKVHPTRIEMALLIEDGTPVRADSVAQVTSLTMLGSNYIEITTGTATAALLEHGSYLEGKPPANMALVFAQAASALEQAELLLQTVNEDILKQDLTQLRDRMRGMFDRAETLLDRMNDVLNDDNRQALGDTIQNVVGATEEMQELLARLDSVVEDAEPEVAVLLAELRRTAENASALSASLDAVIAENRENIAATTESAAAATANIRDLTELLAREPWRLFWRSSRPERVPIAAGEE